MKQQDVGTPDLRPEIEITLVDASSLLHLPARQLSSFEIDVWEFPLEVAESTFKHFTSLLSADEKARAARFHFNRDARHYSVAHGSVRSILAAYLHAHGADLQFVAAKYGKPSLANAALDVRFSVSHSGDCGMLAVALGREVGVDVEIMRENVEVETLAERFFSPRERESLRALPSDKKLPAFFRCWTCKESFLKAQGIGLSRSLDSFDIDLESSHARLLATRPDAEEVHRWSVFEFETVPGYAAAAAVEGAIKSARVFRCR